MTEHAGHEHAKEDEVAWKMQGSSTEVADVLMEFAQGLRSGDVNVWKGQRELHLSPEGRIRMSVDAIADADGYEGLHIKLHWDTTSATADLHGGANTGLPLGGDK